MRALGDGNASRSFAKNTPSRSMYLPQRSFTASQRGIALVTVVSVVALMTVLLVAIFSLSRTELKSAQSQARGEQARQLSEVAVNVVISQLRKATSQDNGSSGWETWTSQPGLARRYAVSGQTLEAYKLYSSSEMIVQGAGSVESKLLADGPPADWQKQKHRYADLNRPVMRTNPAGGTLLHFPIIDPRAQSSNPQENVAGFSYQATTAGGATVAGVVPTGGDAQRLPMPVEWLYVLKDGSVGALDAQGRFQGQEKATATNPIVGRIAFWADDDSSKVNINTASEPTHWALPTFFYEQDDRYARFQPANGEFQRYPGHPATTALSPILLPGRTLTPALKEVIYGLVPKIGPGGSRAGTVSYENEQIAAVDLARYRQERLYASLDEFLLRTDRRPNVLGNEPLSAEGLQRSSFFISARSRSPESNPFGLPKIAMWPVSNRGDDYTTSFDRVIRFCSTLKAPANLDRHYLFQRGWADSTTRDVQFPANDELLRYLHEWLQKPIPGFSPSLADSFESKYGADLPQLLVQFFDYVRSTNLHDGNLVVGKTVVTPGQNATQNHLLGYAPGSKRVVDFPTYTDPRFFAVDPDSVDAGEDGTREALGFPGHGQVAPSHWNYQGTTYQGIARFPTVTEVGLHFICAADNTDDPDNPFQESYDTQGKPGGGSAPKSASEGPQDRWYSNFPPLPRPNPARGESPDLGRYPLTGGYPYGPDAAHPGYQRQNWNHQLAANTPLRPGFRRVQARVLLEYFVPAAGYTILEPDITVRITGLSSFRLNGRPLFPRDSEVVRSGRRATHPGNFMFGGYGIGLKGLMRGREAPARAPMPADNNWGNDNWKVRPSLSASDENCVLNYDFLSNFVDIEVGRDGSQPMEVSQGTLRIEVVSGHLGRRASEVETEPEVVQTLVVPFPVNTVKAPTLVRNNLGRVTNAQGGVVGGHVVKEAPAWWTFYSRGCLGIANMDSITNRSKQGPVASANIRGRHHQHNSPPRNGNELRFGAFFYGFDPVVPGAPRLFRPRRTPGNTQAAIDQAEEVEGSDVVQTVTIRHGDYRHTAALTEVGPEHWQAHRHYGQRRLAHSFTNFLSDHLPGFDYGGSADYDKRLVPNQDGQVYPNHRIPKLPYLPGVAEVAQRYGDFDNGTGHSRDGPYINKPDEGNVNKTANGGAAYLAEPGQHTTVDEVFFSPNRLLPSPVMFGSLPAKVRGNEPWRTLLFRPQLGHPGGSSSNGGFSPPDHLLLEFFWMPVVEPYAISEPFSTAGKINLNYQIFPFTNIRRATGLHAVLASEVLHAVPNEDISRYKVFPTSDPSVLWGADQGKRWHFPIDADKTLAQFEHRFRQGRGFISPSEICDIHLVPEGTVESHAQMDAFWQSHRLTGDNTRERPYANLYPRLTTRSNTFRVHFIAQTIQKTRSSDPAMMTDEDKATSEYRGSTLLERYLDPQQQGMPDFATSTAGLTLDHFHRFRVVETKRFGF
jgi:uncharacterized protein (TIGR02600 family)